MQETSLGRLEQPHENTISTKPGQVTTEDTEVKEKASILDLPTTRSKIVTDQTGRFATISGMGSTYVLTPYDYDSNAILAEPTKSHNQNEILRAYKKLHTKPKLQLLDNEASTLLKDEITKLGIK